MVRVFLGLDEKDKMHEQTASHPHPRTGSGGVGWNAEGEDGGEVLREGGGGREGLWW